MTPGDNSQNWEHESRRGYLAGDGRAPIVIRGSEQSVAPLSWTVNESNGSQLNIAEYWRTIVKHRVVIAICLVATLAGGAIVTVLTDPTYTAGTTLQIDREAAKIVNVQGVEPTDHVVAGEEFFETQYGLLKSRSLATRVVESLGLAANDGFLNQMGAGKGKSLFGSNDERTPAEKAAARKLAAIRLVEGNLGVEPVRGSRLVRLTFESPDPKLAARIANAVGENFIASNLERRFESSSYARDFLESQLKRVKQRLEDSEKQLAAYATSQQIINVNDGVESASGVVPTQSLSASNLVAINMALAGAKADRIKAEQRWRQAQSTSGLGLTDILQSPTIQNLSQSRAKLNSEYRQGLSVYKADYPSMLQLKAQIDETDRQLESEAKTIRESMRSQYVIALNQERSLAGQVEQLKGAVLDLRGRSIQYNILQREVDTNRTLYDGLLQRYKEVGVAGGVGTNNISIVDRAEPPLVPSKPKPLVNMVLAAMLGIAVGVGIAFLLEALDESINTPEDVEAKLGLSLLGSVPTLDKGVTPVVALADIRSAFSEAYYSIRTALQFSTNDGVPRSLLVTSARPSEGKSTTAMAIAQNFARLGIRVLLVDGDLRNPSMHRNLGGDNSIGLSNVLTGSCPYREAVQGTFLPSLSFIPCGPLPPNPAELLGGPRLRAFLTEATSDFELVLIDGPPVMGLADAPILTSIVEGTVLVIEAGGTRRGLVKTALRRLAVGNTRLLGAILTKFNARKASYGSTYAYSYEYNYGSRPKIAADA